MLAITLHQFHTIRIEHKGEVITLTAKNIFNQKARIHVRGPKDATITRTTEHFEDYKLEFEKEVQRGRDRLLSWAATSLSRGE